MKISNLRRIWSKAILLFPALCIGGEVACLIDAGMALAGKELPVQVFLTIAASLTALLMAMAIWKRLRPRFFVWFLCLIPVCLGMVLLCGYGLREWFCAEAVYEEVDYGKEKMYAGQKVMLIVPHQDDEINILGGVLEEYARYGSEIYAVFMTNGDYMNQGAVRIQEAIEYFAHLGVPEEHVIFLGYGNEWKTDGPHLYNAEPGTVVESYAGYRKTYATEQHPAFREGNAYTAENLLQDMEDVILEHKADVIFCIDYDFHIDHKANTLLFEKAIGNILKKRSDYKPVIYKAFAYSSAWYANEDFYGENIRSTYDMMNPSVLGQPGNYRWEERVRFPVRPSSLSRSIYSSGLYETLEIYASQNVAERGERIINGDKVAWQRFTTSVCNQAEMEVSSGNKEFLNDFMLLENRCLTDADHLPYDGVWIPENMDTEKKVTVNLKEKTDLFSIVLYDHPAEDQNVLRVRIAFDDGTSLEYGPLHPTGASSPVAVNKKNVGSFSVEILSAEGACAGLAEIEAFCEPNQDDRKMVKLMDADENLAYDYYIDSQGTEEFFVYTYGNVPQLENGNYTVSFSNEKGKVSWEDGKIKLYCPVGEEGVLTIRCNTEDLSDSIYVRNPRKLVRTWVERNQQAEQWFRQRQREGFFDTVHEKTAAYKLYVKFHNFMYRLKHW